MAGGKKSSRGASGGNLILRKTLASVGMDPSSYHDFRGVGRPSSSALSKVGGGSGGASSAFSASQLSLYPCIVIPNPKRLRSGDKAAVTTVREVQALVHAEHFVRPKPAVAPVQNYLDKKEVQDGKVKVADLDASYIFTKCLGGKQVTERGKYFPDELVTGQRTSQKRALDTQHQSTGGAGGGGGGGGTGAASGADNNLLRLRNLYKKEQEILKNGGGAGGAGGAGGEDDEEDNEAEEEEVDQDVDADYTKDYYASDDDDDDGGGGDDEEGGVF